MSANSLKPHIYKIRSPFGEEKVYKDECIFSFDTPESETGLYICMSTLIGLGKKHVAWYYTKTGNAVFLHLRRIKYEIPAPDKDEQQKPTRLAIGLEGGFNAGVQQYEFEEKACVVVLPEWIQIALDDPELSPEVQVSAAAILAADSAAKKEELAALNAVWDGEKRQVSKHAETLTQLDNGKKIPPSGWKCEQCDKTDNLWLNLTDGSILCGRKFWDGSGGNNHAVEHYAQVHHPLAVKLGTITPQGADVFSYNEDDMVEDPYLAKHLAHWGIDILSMQKTEQTMSEMEVALNERMGEWAVLQESDSALQLASGPGLTGMLNLGNSCYMNSVIQTIVTIPDFANKYSTPVEELPRAANGEEASKDFTLQMCKLTQGLLSGLYSQPSDTPTTQSGNRTVVFPNGIRPQMFKTLIGRGHPEFSTKRQQDAQEFLLYLLNTIELNCRGSENPCESVKFETEERIECTQSKRVKYTHREDFLLALPIPMDAITNKDEVAAYEAAKKENEQNKIVMDSSKAVRPRIPLSACLEAYGRPEFIEGFYSTAVNANTTAKKTTRMSSFPDYLLVQLKKYTIGSDWVPKKLDVEVEMSDELDLSTLRGIGLQLCEQELPEGTAPQPAVQLDEATISGLVEMGFPREGCKKAVFHTNNTGLEPAMNWVMEHMADPDFGDPFVPPGGCGNTAAQFVPDEEGVAMVMGMGFSRDQAVKALKATENSVERAVDWIFSDVDDIDAMETEPAAAAGGGGDTIRPKYRDGAPKYKLAGFISHMGTSTMVGHYVCHLLKGGRWVIFNDEKVAYSEKPPKNLGYIYLYQRI